jgi:hypothetical protein
MKMHNHAHFQKPHSSRRDFFRTLTGGTRDHIDGNSQNWSGTPVESSRMVTRFRERMREYPLSPLAFTAVATRAAIPRCYTESGANEEELQQVAGAWPMERPVALHPEAQHRSSPRMFPAKQAPNKHRKLEMEDGPSSSFPYGSNSSHSSDCVAFTACRSGGGCLRWG